MKLLISLILLFCIMGGTAMAYDIHISRGYKYADSGHSKITLDEWNDIISQHKEMEVVNEIKSVNPQTKEVIVIKTPNAALYKKNNTEILFRWSDGIIMTKYATMSDKVYWHEVARWLNAQVYGEEGDEIE